MSNSPDSNSKKDVGHTLPGRPVEPPVRKHPYTLYIVLTAVIFAVMMAVVYFAVNTEGFIPQRLQRNAEPTKTVPTEIAPGDREKATEVPVPAPAQE
jgi:hypothetical protein